MNYIYKVMSHTHIAIYLDIALFYSNYYEVNPSQNGSSKSAPYKLLESSIGADGLHLGSIEADLKFQLPLSYCCCELTLNIVIL